ncbi:hypothetical protein CYMTET_15541 [Cymbomonas tetramitiformis]|uniref:Uncharacterized protein n=1 Tax=Cymbomonas tetramitiformis TaxID=36881 RepID=A0AAE0L8W7_9CHLO|nr:hypothetical protein CYMTET_15541 [Cymbomonas tetramitiformis]
MFDTPRSTSNADVRTVGPDGQTELIKPTPTSNGRKGSVFRNDVSSHISFITAHRSLEDARENVENILASTVLRSLEEDAVSVPSADSLFGARLSSSKYLSLPVPENSSEEVGASLSSRRQRFSLCTSAVRLPESAGEFFLKSSVALAPPSPPPAKRLSRGTSFKKKSSFLQRSVSGRASQEKGSSPRTGITPDGSPSVSNPTSVDATPNRSARPSAGGISAGSTRTPNVPGPPTNLSSEVLQAAATAPDLQISASAVAADAAPTAPDGTGDPTAKPRGTSAKQSQQGQQKRASRVKSSHKSNSPSHEAVSQYLNRARNWQNMQKRPAASKSPTGLRFGAESSLARAMEAPEDAYDARLGWQLREGRTGSRSPRSHRSTSQRTEKLATPRDTLPEEPEPDRASLLTAFFLETRENAKILARNQERMDVEGDSEQLIQMEAQWAIQDHAEKVPSLEELQKLKRAALNSKRVLAAVQVWWKLLEIKPPAQHGFMNKAQWCELHVMVARDLFGTDEHDTEIRGVSEQEWYHLFSAKGSPNPVSIDFDQFHDRAVALLVAWAPKADFYQLSANLLRLAEATSKATLSNALKMRRHISVKRPGFKPKPNPARWYDAAMNLQKTNAQPAEGGETQPVQEPPSEPPGQLPPSSRWEGQALSQIETERHVGLMPQKRAMTKLPPISSPVSMSMSVGHMAGGGVLETLDTPNPPDLAYEPSIEYSPTSVLDARDHPYTGLSPQASLSNLPSFTYSAAPPPANLERSVSCPPELPDLPPGLVWNYWQDSHGNLFVTPMATKYQLPAPETLVAPDSLARGIEWRGIVPAKMGGPNAGGALSTRAKQEKELFLNSKRDISDELSRNDIAVQRQLFAEQALGTNKICPLLHVESSKTRGFPFPFWETKTKNLTPNQGNLPPLKFNGDDLTNVNLTSANGSVHTIYV